MYNICVKIEGIESRRRSAGLLHIAIGLFLLVNVRHYLVQTAYHSILFIIPAVLVALLSLGYGFFRRIFDITAKYNYWIRLLQVITFTIMGFGWLSTGRAGDIIAIFIFTFLCILLMFSERRIFMETVIKIDGNGLSIPGYYRDHLLRWEQLSEVVVREDFITIFHIRNKYLQFRVKQDLSTLEVAKMNAFCREQIEKIAEHQATES